MKLDNQTKILMLQNRISLMKARGEETRRPLIAKALRQIRKLQSQAE